MSPDIVFAVAATAPSTLPSVDAAWQGEGEFIDVELGRVQQRAWFLDRFGGCCLELKRAALWFRNLVCCNFFLKRRSGCSEDLLCS
jgi:hypothetical protein